MGKTTPVTQQRFEVLAQSCLVLWKPYFTNEEHYQYIMGLAKLLDDSKVSEQACVSTTDSYVMELSKTLSQSQLAQIIKEFTRLCQFFKERGALAKNPFVFTDEPALIPKHQNLPVEILKERIQEHLDYRVTLSKIALGSVSAYSSDLNQLFNFLIEFGLELTVEALEKFALWLKKEHNYADTTIARKKNVIRAYLQTEIMRKNIQLDERYLNYLMTKKRDRTPQNPHVSLSLDEVNRLIAYIATLDLHDQLKILIPLLLGVRGEETVDLQVKHFNFIGGNVDLLETKSGLPRSIPLPDFLEQMLKDYIKLMNLRYFDYLFPSNRKGTAISRRTLTEHIKKIIIDAGIERPVTTHDLRSTYANLQYYHNETDLNTLQKLLGHKDPATTLQYIGTKQQDRKPPLSQLYHEWSRLLCPNLVTRSQDTTDMTTLYYYPRTQPIPTVEASRAPLFRVVK